MPCSRHWIIRLVEIGSGRIWGYYKKSRIIPDVGIISASQSTVLPLEFFEAVKIATESLLIQRYLKGGLLYAEIVRREQSGSIFSEYIERRFAANPLVLLALEAR